MRGNIVMRSESWAGVGPRSFINHDRQTGTPFPSGGKMDSKQFPTKPKRVYKFNTSLTSHTNIPVNAVMIKLFNIFTVIGKYSKNIYYISEQLLQKHHDCKY